MIEMIEIIFLIIIIDFFIVWLSKAIDKFNRLKQYEKEFVKRINDKDSSENVPQK